MNQHLFSQQVLQKSKINIISNNKKILDSGIIKKNLYNNPFYTKYPLHKFVSLSDKQTKFIETYDDLLRMGFQISKKRVSGKYFANQKIEYFLLKTTYGNQHLGYIPQNHKIQYNFVENWIRLIGSNSSGKRVYIKYTHNPKIYRKELTLEDYEEIESDYCENISPFTLIERQKKKIIEEIPILLTDDGILVCLAQMHDNPTIGVFGKKGMGKTMFLHRLADCVYHKWNKRIIILNDGVNFQTKSWSLPWNTDKHKFFITRLNQIGEETRPLPCVYFFPSVKNMGNIDMENEVSFKIALPFSDIMENPNSFFEGTKDELFKSEKYLKNLIYDDKGEKRPDGLLYINKQSPLEDIKRLINEKTWIEQTILNGKTELIQRKEEFIIPETSRGMIFSLLKELITSDIFDINTGLPSKWIVDVNENKYTFYPWNACLFSDIVPVIVTSDLRFDKFYASYLRFILNDIFRNQTKNDIIKRNKIELWCIIDEIQDLLRYPPALESFRMINKEARNNRMGIVYATQFLGDIPEDIYLTTDFIVSFQQTSSKANEIGKNIDAMAHQTKDLVKLKKFESMISGKLLITYDTDGNRNIIEDGTPFKGIIFPSVSQHSAPKEVGI